MIISYYTHEHGLNTNTGYGYAGLNVVRSLQKLGHQVPFGDASAPVQIHFTPPHFYPDRVPGQYYIGYTPWESTELKPGWLEKMNMCDEVWTPSPLIAGWFKDAGVKPPIYVYEHGVAEVWSPVRRVRKGKEPLRFLNHGAEASRKCGQFILDAFLEVFGRNSDEASITFKTNGPPPMRIEKDGFLYNPLKYSPKNIKVLPSHIDINELVSLYHDHHVLIGNSQAEGFGLTQLQAMATGMPVVMNKEWAPYSRFILPELSVSSKLVNTRWKVEHPGKIWQPSFEETCAALRAVAEDFNTFSDKAYDLSPQVREEYDWLKVTEDAFAHIVEKFS